MSKVDRAEDGFGLPRLEQEDGSAFGYFDRWFLGTTPDGRYITDLSDWEAREMWEMLRRDYKAQQIEKVLSLPLTSAEYTIQPAKGDKGEAEWLKTFWEADAFAGGCRTSLDQIIGLMTSAFYYKRAYFEKVFCKGKGQFAGKIVYEDVAFRPQTTCRLMREPKNGRYVGFEQEAYYLGPEISSDPNKWPIQIKANRAFVYTHGTRRDPLNGVSDTEVALWAWKTKQKVLMLWFQFLQGVALPRITVKAGDQGTATQVAQEIARLKGSGVLPLATPGGPDSVAVETLDASGKGSEQFQAAITWLDTAATGSVLAGFLDLTAAIAGGKGGNHGSYALSKDASDFFLQSLEAKAREMEDQIRRQLFAPLIRHNFGPDAAVPKLQFEPLNDIDKEASVDLLKQAMAAPPGGPVPTTFIAELAGQVATYLGLEGEKTREDFKKSFDAAAAQAQAKMLAETPGGASPTGQAVAGLAGAVNAAHKAIQAGVNPAKAHADARRAVGTDAKGAARQGKVDAGRQALLEKHAKNVVHAKTNGEVSLSTEDTDLAGFNPAEPRSAGGTWTAGGQAQAQKKPSQAQLLKEKAALTAEAKVLRASIAKFHPLVKGSHKGQASGTHKGAKAAPTKAGKGSAPSAPGHSGGSHPSLMQQVINLRHTVEHLKRELVDLQQAAAKKHRKPEPQLTGSHGAS